MDDITAGFKQSLGCNEELHTLHSSPYALREMKVKEREMSRACSTYVEEVHARFREEHLNGRDRNEHLRIIRKVVLKYFLKNWDWRV